MADTGTQQPYQADTAHAMPAAAVLAAVHGDPDGLSTAEAAARRGRWGPNDIPAAAGNGLWMVFLRQFASPLIYVLALAAGLSVWLGEWSDAAFIAAVLLLNAAIGSTQEHRAERSAQALRRMVTTASDVVRDGNLLEIDARELVVGDVVLLSSGMRVPADVRLLDSQGLQVDESPLTGESLPVDKNPRATVPRAAALGDRPTMAYAGTLVGRGRGRGVVTATGATTQVGALAGELREPSSVEAPLLTRMRRFALVVGLGVALVALAVGAVETVRGTPWHEVVLIGVALAVSAVPEGLPVALTVALAVAVRRMARREVIVRRLVAVESLGSCTVVASDKTGTLTVNELTVTHVAVPGCEPWEVTGVGADPTGSVMVDGADADAGMAAAERLARAGVLCNEATLAATEDGWVHRGDAVDVAMLVLGRKLGISRPVALDGAEQLAAIPFESEHRYAATLHAADPGTARIVVKGAVERVRRMCTTMVTLHGERPIDAEQVDRMAERLASTGERVVALAVRRVGRRDGGPGADPDLDHDELTGMTLLGLVGMSDPLRPDSPAAIAACRRAGISVVMITGDHAATALAAARELGLADGPDEVVTGHELHTAANGAARGAVEGAAYGGAQGAGPQEAGPEGAGPQEAGPQEAGPEGAGRGGAESAAAVDALTARATVFARVEPAQKLDIVESLTRRGEVVAVTGDGANDAPALHHAHVGVAMGRSGTDVAREAAEIVVTDDQFGSIAAGVEEGRIAYANVRKVIQLLIATGAGELVLVLAALTMGLPLPLLAVQLLWLNLVTNGIQDVALAFEPGEGDEMRRRPRPPGEPVFDRLMVERVLLSAAVIGGVTVAFYQWLLAAGWSVEDARNSVVLLMVLFENVHVFNSRSELRSVFTHDPRRNLLLVGSTLLAQALHIVAMHVPFTQAVLGLHPVSLAHWATLLGLATTLLVAVELHKAFCRRRARRS
ncbi:cation-translocating P-type ATPase [Myceligenerans indicum]|uniref:HAD-IC family P-type ATPase n=1 Tax=Myceligenerans indicum TaxID=2593663 RepID=A0ABS1LJA2_9MICO|nr:HAD-IC family P-type ATPase [Myceligenerans indicum]MBL0886282.1 HAD-IC family P-type ATPase [Myceligenerans indicum]